MPLQVLPGSEVENPPIPSSYDDGKYFDVHKELLDRMDQTYTQASPIWQAFWNEANTDMRVYAGDQSVWQNYGNSGDFNNGRRPLHFNRTARVVDMICGNQRRNRKTSIVTPQHANPENQQEADDLSGLLQWAYNYDKTYDKISDAFGHCTKVGLSFIESWIDRRSDIVHGDLNHRVIEYGSVFCDPMFRNLDLSDCSYIWVRRWMTRDQLLCLMPDQTEQIDSITTSDLRDSRFYFMPENQQMSLRGLVAVDEFWYADTREARALVNIKTGEMKEIKEGVEVDPNLFTEIPELREVKYQKPTVRLGISCNRKVLYHGENPLKIDRYPFTPFVSYFEPSFTDWPYKFQGVVRRIRDAQYLYNRRKQIELDILESQVNSGELVEEDFYLTPEDAMRSGQGTVRFFKRGKNPAVSRIREIAPEIPQSMIQVSESLGNEMAQISGVNEELLGSADDDKSGILSMLRQGAGLTTLQTILDRMDAAQRMVAEIDLEIIQKHWSKEKMARILGRMPSEGITSPYLEKYDIAVEDGILTATQRQMQARQLSDLKQMGYEIPASEILRNLSIQNKNELIEAMEQQQQAMQQQAAQIHETEMHNRAVENDALIAKAEGERALAHERMGKLAYEQAANQERVERSKEEQSAAVLNMVKALKEIEGMDIANMVNRLTALKHLSDANRSETAEPKQPELRELPKSTVEGANDAQPPIPPMISAPNPGQDVSPTMAL